MSACTTHCMEAVCWAGFQAGNTISDSQSNTWHRVAVQNNSGQTQSELWISFTPTVSSTQTFTASGGASSLSAMAFNGVASGPDQQNGAVGGSSPLSAGSVTPTNAGELVLSCFSGYAPTSPAIAGPLVGLDLFSWISTAEGLGSGYQIQTTATAENPSWSWTGGAIFGAAIVATFYSTTAPATLTVTTTTLPEGFNGSPYTTTIQSNGGVSPFTWSQTAGTLPSGLNFSSGGVLSGTPTAAVLNAPQTFKVTDSTSATASSSGLTLTVAASALQITTTTCPAGTQGSSYAGCTLVATGGTSPYTFSMDTSVNYPTLPEGIAVNGSTGVLSSSQIGGQGNYTAGLIVTDSKGATAENAILFSITGNNGFMSTIFPSNSIFHHRVDAASTGLPVDTSPAAPINSAYTSHAIEPLFGASENAPYPGGIPAFYVPCNQADVSITTTVYQSYFTSAPIPNNAPVEGTANSTPQGPDNHVLIYQQAGCGNPPMLWEMWQGIYEGGPWTDSSNALWTDVSGNALTPQGMGTTDAAGLPVAPLLLNADEVIGTGSSSAPNGVVMHPTRFTIPHAIEYWVWPSTATSGVGNCSGTPTYTLISQSSPPAGPCTWSGPMGEIYRLKASVGTPSCAATSPQAAIIITGFRNYGIILADNGGAGYVIGTPDPRWNDADLACLEQLTLGNFEPVNVSSLIYAGTDSGETPPVTPPPPVAGTPTMFAGGR